MFSPAWACVFSYCFVSLPFLWASSKLVFSFTPLGSWLLASSQASPESQLESLKNSLPGLRGVQSQCLGMKGKMSNCSFLLSALYGSVGDSAHTREDRETVCACTQPRIPTLPVIVQHAWQSRAGFEANVVIEHRNVKCLWTN